jgi:hypothetical protein
MQKTSSDKGYEKSFYQNFPLLTISVCENKHHRSTFSSRGYRFYRINDFRETPTARYGIVSLESISSISDRRSGENNWIL